MNQKELIEYIKNNFKGIENIKSIDEKQFSITVQKERIINILSFLKLSNFKELALITAVDWIKEEKIEVVYILFSYEYEQQLIVKTYIDRQEPSIESIKNLWEIATMYERDVHEFFGIDFIGNDDKRPLILHNWKDIPPLRKDFDSLKYSNTIFGKFKKDKE